MPVSRTEAAEQNALYLAMAVKLLRANAFSTVEGVPNVGSIPVQAWTLMAYKTVGEKPVVEIGYEELEGSPTSGTREVPKAVRVRAFLQQVYELSAGNQIDEGIDLV